MKNPVPQRLAKEISEILISKAQLAARVEEIASAIEKDYEGKELVIVSLLNGTVVFLADLIRHLTLPVRLDFIGVSSYRMSTTSGDLVFTKELMLDIAGKDVLLVDDILDTGKTLTRVRDIMLKLKPNSIKTCVLFNKEARRTSPIKANYVGFDIPDTFIVGYGLDFAEKYRNLPFVGVLHPDILKGGEHA